MKSCCLQLESLAIGFPIPEEGLNGDAVSLLDQKIENPFITDMLIEEPLLRIGSLGERILRIP